MQKARSDVRADIICFASSCPWSFCHSCLLPDSCLPWILFSLQTFLCLFCLITCSNSSLLLHSLSCVPLSSLSLILYCLSSLLPPAPVSGDFLMPSEGTPVQQAWVDRSDVPADMAAAGSKFLCSDTSLEPLLVVLFMDLSIVLHPVKTAFF